MLKFLKAAMGRIVSGASPMTWAPGVGEMVIHLDRHNRLLRHSKNAPSTLGRTSQSLKQLSVYQLVCREDQDRLAEVLNYVRRSKPPASTADPAIVRHLDVMMKSCEGEMMRCALRVQARDDGQVMMLIQEAAPVPAPMPAPVSAPGLALDPDRLADLSHEMKTPLNAILGFSDAMREATFGPLGHAKYQDYADHIYTSGEHLMDLVTSILDLARIDADQYQLQLTLGNLGEIVTECVEMIRPQSDAAGLNFVVEAEAIDDSLLDVQAVRQILINLFSNAVKFTSDGSINVCLRRDGARRLEVIVRDTGIGMSPDQLAHLGERFTSASGDGVRGNRGNGLGLALAISLARLHGGALIIDGAPGEGVTAILSLPVREAHTRPLRKALERSGDKDKISARQTPSWGQAAGARPPGLCEVTGSTASAYQSGPPEALQTQMERIDEYRRKINTRRDVNAA